MCLSENQKTSDCAFHAIEWDDHFYVVDCGPDFRQQMLRCNARDLSGILFTHEHTDPAGLDDIRPFFFDKGRLKCT